MSTFIPTQESPLNPSILKLSAKGSSGRFCERAIQEVDLAGMTAIAFNGGADGPVDEDAKNAGWYECNVLPFSLPWKARYLIDSTVKAPDLVDNRDYFYFVNDDPDNSRDNYLFSLLHGVRKSTKSASVRRSLNEQFDGVHFCEKIPNKELKKLGCIDGPFGCSLAVWTEGPNEELVMMHVPNDDILVPSYTGISENGSTSGQQLARPLSDFYLVGALLPNLSFCWGLLDYNSPTYEQDLAMYKEKGLVLKLTEPLSYLEGVDLLVGRMDRCFELPKVS
ncbi:MAG: hypothetical protein AAF433_19950 [Bacteroidota bacterium]